MAIVMEYLSGGELTDYLESRGGRLEEKEAHRFFKQIAAGVEYCHSRNLVHRDLKLENILLESRERPLIKIVDFGISSIAHSERYAYGSLKYMAPELVSRSNTNSDPKLDVWSMGCILYMLLVGWLPFGGRSRHEIANNIVGQELAMPPNGGGVQISEEARDLVRRMLVKNPVYRVSLQNVLTHPWLEGESALKDLSSSSKNSKTNGHNSSGSVVDAPFINSGKQRPRRNDGLKQRRLTFDIQARPYDSSTMFFSSLQREG